MANDISPESEEISERLHSTAIHLLRRLRREDDGSELNAPRLSALSVIVFGGTITLGNLAAAEQVRPPTMTRMVNALEELGLIRKDKSCEDARSIQISATRKGRDLLIAGRERRVRALAMQVQLVTPRERDILASAGQILSEIVRRMQRDSDTNEDD